MKKNVVSLLFISLLSLTLPLNAFSFGPDDKGKSEAISQRDIKKGMKSALKSLSPKKINADSKKKGKSSNPVDIAINAMNMQIPGNNSHFVLRKHKTDRLGYSHVYLQQAFKGIPIAGAEVIVHINKADEITSVTGYYAEGIYLSVTLKLNERQAMAIASDDLGFDVESLIVNSPEVIIYAEELTYRFSVNDAAANAEWVYYVSARTGEIISKYNNIKHLDPGNGSAAVVEGDRIIGEDGSHVFINGWLDNVSGNYFLYSFANLWGIFDADVADWSQNSSPNWGATDPAAISAGLNFEITQNYVSTVLGWDSFDNQGGFAQGNIHYSTNYVNAFWNGTDFTFGDGNGTTAGPLTTLDIVAHEYGHAITDYSSDLTYSYESGALNESFSDVLGIAIEFHNQPDGTAVYPTSNPGEADWLQGEDSWLSAEALRDLRDPQRFNQPSYYQGTKWWTSSGDNGGVHYNSGVQNHAYYLLSVGGSGLNDGHAYGPINGLGVQAATEIAMYANMYLLTASSDYYDARNAWILAAETLGYSTEQVQSVSEAWVAVGVSPVKLEAPASIPNAVMGQPYSLQMIVTGAVAPYTCSLAEGSALPDGLTINGSTCEISGTPAIQTAGIYQVGIEVVDSIGMPASRIVPINVVSPIVVTPPSPVPIAYLGQPYSAQMTVTGGLEPYTCSVGRYGLVAGLTLDATTCEISGEVAIQTPRNRSTEIIAVDAMGMSGSRIFTISVRSPITIQLPSPIPIPIVNEPFSLVSTVTGAVGSYTCSASNLPSGLVIDSTTCEISGSPTSFGLYQTTINVVDSIGIPSSLSVSLDVFDKSKLFESFSTTTETSNQSRIDVAADASGNVYVATQTSLLKYTNQLDLVWTMPFAGQIHAIMVNPAGNIIVTGKDTVTGHFLTGVYDSEQNEIWLKSYDGGAALVNSEMTIDANGVAFISGVVMDHPAAFYKFVVIKYDELGVATPFLELDAYHSNSRVDGIVTDSAGNVYLANDYGSSYGNSELISKYSPEGVLLWDTTAWNYYYQHGTGGMAIDANDNIYIGLYGWSGSQYKSDFRSYTSEGTQRWRKVFSLPGGMNTFDLTVNKDGVLFVLVNFSGGINGYDTATLVNRDPSQSEVWGFRRYDSGFNDTSSAVASGPDGELYVAGRSHYSYGMLIRYDATDVDEDGYESVAYGGSDCNDNDPLINPGAVEVCDQVDNNCDGQVDEGVTITFYLDADLDGYGGVSEPPLDACVLPSGYSTDNTDCNDGDSSVYPDAPEVKQDGIDQDCNGYDLTINITKAEYVQKKDELFVTATSDNGSAAALEVEGFGPMTWQTDNLYWELKLSPVNLPNLPSTVIVLGPEGQETATLTIK